MDDNIARLAAACGLPGFRYHTWAAPEIVLTRPEPVEEAPAAPPFTEAEEAAVLAVPEPPPSSPVSVAMPASIPARLPGQPARTSITLPLPEPEPLATLPFRERRAAGRAPVVLPPPDAGAPIVPFRPVERREAGRRVSVSMPPPRAAASPRRFALLEEIGTPPEDRRRPPRPPAT